MEFSRGKNILVLLIVATPFVWYLSLMPMPWKASDVVGFLISKSQGIINKVYSKDYVYTKSSVAALDASIITEAQKPMENPPTILKSVYVTGWSAGSQKYLEYLNNLFKTTQINSVVIDVKDSSGALSYNTKAPKAKEYHAWQREIPDIDALIKNLHSQGIYVIGRVTVFEDPVLAKNRPDLAVYDTALTNDALSPVLWADNNGLSWVDPASKEVWDYNIAIARDALLHGFDEVNFDYMRFPTDGKDTMGFPFWNPKTPKSVVIKSFFQKLRESFPDARLSVDIFGQTTTNTDDMGIGQIFENALSYFDYVCPMVYPSHYASGFLGYKNPADHPYQIVKNAIDSAVARKQVYDLVTAKKSQGVAPASLAQVRPWLQDFSLGAIYNADMVGQEIKAVSDATGKEFSGFLLWNPSNYYTKAAILLGTVAPE